MSDGDHPTSRQERVADLRHQIIGDVTVIRAHSQLLRRRCRDGRTISPEDLCKRLELLEAVTMRIAQSVDRLAAEQAQP